MTAIATDGLKFRFADLLFNEIINATDNNHFYIGIGKSDQYDSASDNVVDPLRNERDDKEARNNLESIIKVSETAMSFTIPRHNWTSGTIYDAWSDKQVGRPTNPFYVITEDQQVYICVANNKNQQGQVLPSIIKPSYSVAGVPFHRIFKTSDGYVWKFLYEMTTARTANFLSAGFMPVQFMDSSSASVSADNDQAKVRSTSKPGQIIGVDIIDRGEGYLSTPTLTFVGDGAGATGTVTLDGTSIGKIDMVGTVADSGMGSGYNFARVDITGGTPSRPAVLRPIIGPRDGFGHDPRRDLKSTSLMFNAKPVGAQNGEFSVSTTGTFGGQSDFRQITLFRNLDHVDSSVAGNRVELSASRVNRVVTLTTKPAFVKDEKVTGQSSGTITHIDHIDSTGGGGLRLHYHFNNRVDFKPGTFTSSEIVQGATSGVSGTVDSDSQPKVLGGAIDRYSGDLLYIDNRSRIVRSTTQTEDIKIILTV